MKMFGFTTFIDFENNAFEKRFFDYVKKNNIVCKVLPYGDARCYYLTFNDGSVFDSIITHIIKEKENELCVSGLKRYKEVQEIFNSKSNWDWDSFGAHLEELGMCYTTDESHLYTEENDIWSYYILFDAGNIQVEVVFDKENEPYVYSTIDTINEELDEDGWVHILNDNEAEYERRIGDL